MNTHTPTVTVVVPTIGQTRFLKETIASVRSQTIADIEVLVVDNSQIEGGAPAFAQWAKEDPRVRIVRVETRLQMFSNFNRGIFEAKGKYLAFFHDDDVYGPRFLEVLVNGLVENPSAALAGSNYDFIDADGTITESRRWISQTALVPGREYIQKLIRRGRNIVSMPGIVYRRSAIADGFDTTLSAHFGDFVLLMRICESNDFFMSAEPLMQVRRHEKQASQSMPFADAIAQRTNVLLAYCDEFISKHPDEAALVSSLRNWIQVQHRVGLLWGWASSVDDTQAHLCSQTLGTTLPDEVLRGGLRLVERTGARALFSRPGVKDFAKKIATVLGA